MLRIHGPVAGVALALFACLWGVATATAASPRFLVKPIATFTEPTYVTGPPSGRRLFVVERRGRIRIVRRGKVLRRPFLDMSKTTMTALQRGLFSMAFAPDYARSGRFYVEYVRGPGDTVQLDEFRRSASDPNRAAPSSRRHVLNVGHGGDYHHGGQLQFGPDGYLYMSTGVSEHPEWGQDLGNLHGKILRIDPRAAGDRPYTVPAGNPFAFTAGARPEIWAYGMRNPWRFSFDRRTGDFVLGDVGADTAEEVDFLKRGISGANFGFPIFEGRRQMIPGAVPPHYVAPVIQHLHHPHPYCAVTGGYVVRDRGM